MKSWIYIVFSIVCLFILMSCSEEDDPIEREPIEQNTQRITYAYVSDGSYSIGSKNSLRIINVTDQEKPQEMGFVNLPSTMSGANGIYLVGKYAYVADNHNNPDIWVIDVSEPTNPKVVGSCDTPSFAQNIYVDGGYAYVADGEAGLQVIDISDPTNPKVIGFCDTPGNAVGVGQKYNYCYIADYFEGLRIIDISDPTKPKEVGFYKDFISTCSMGIYLTDSFCYLAHIKGLDVIDIFNPRMPERVAFCNTLLGGMPRRIYVYDDCAYLTGGEIGIIMVDISFPRKPREIGSFDTPGYARGIYVTDNVFSN